MCCKNLNKYIRLRDRYLSLYPTTIYVLFITQVNNSPLIILLYINNELLILKFLNNPKLFKLIMIQSNVKTIIWHFLPHFDKEKTLFKK